LANPKHSIAILHNTVHLPFCKNAIIMT